MKKYLILLAGCPGTGKSYLLNLLHDSYEDLVSCVPDNLKEEFADTFGFNSLDEKCNLEKKVWKEYYKRIEQFMIEGVTQIASEYPFSYKQKSIFEEYSNKYGYKVITIRLEASFEVLWKRRYERDRNQDRHLSHLMTQYHKGDILIDRTLADNHISEEEFKAICEDRNYGGFALGTLFRVNVEDFNKVNYDSLLKKLNIIFET